MELIDIISTTNSLNNIEEEISKVLIWSLNDIRANPSNEKEIICLWKKHIAHISDLLFLECDRTGNKEVYKKLVKSIIFKKNKF